MVAILKYVQIVLLVMSFLSVVYVDNEAAKSREQTAVAESCNTLAMLVNARAELVRSNGLGAIPIDDQAAWESMDWFCVDVKTQEFSTLPRFEPLRSRVRESMQEDYKGPRIKNSTNQFNLVVNTGQPVVGEFPDYRGTPVISASELVTLENGTIHAVFVEIDLAEVIKTAMPDSRDELTVGICSLLGFILLLITDVRHRKARKLNCEFEIASAEVIKRNEALRQENERLIRKAKP